jgi:hypothetical protein
MDTRKYASELVEKLFQERDPEIERELAVVRGTMILENNYDQVWIPNAPSWAVCPFHGTVLRMLKLLEVKPHVNDMMRQCRDEFQPSEVEVFFGAFFNMFCKEVRFCIENKTPLCQHMTTWVKNYPKIRI